MILMRPSRFTRRAFLARLGVTGAAFAAPFVPVLEADGADGAIAPKRLLLFFTPHGTVWNRWLPSGTVSSFTLGPILAPLERHKRKLTIVAGLGIPDKGVGAPHTKGPSLLWTGSTLLDDGTFNRSDCSGGCTFGWNSGPSIDQTIVAALKPATPYPSLQFGTRCGGNGPATRMIYSAAKMPLPPETDPWAAFGRLFSGAAQPSALVKLRAERQRSFALVKAELDALRARAGAADRAKIDGHLAAVATLQDRLGKDLALCQAPALGTKVAANDAVNTPVVMERHFDLIAAALACDLTRFASYQHTVGDNDGTVYSWLGHTDSHHTMSHAPDADTATWDKLTAIYAWYATRLASLLDRLEAIPEGSGTMLDNTLVVWGSELGKGNSHSFAQVPFVLAGGAGGALAPGRFLQYSGVTHNRLLVSVAHALGAAAVDTMGNTDLGRGPLPGLL